MAAEARVGTIAIGMRVADSGFTKGLAKKSQQLSGFAASIPGLVTGGLAALGITKVASDLMGLRTAAADNLDTLGALSERVGATVSNLAGLQYAAKLANVEQGGLSTALTKLGVNLGEIAGGGGEKAAEALTRLGLSSKSLASMDRVEAFKQVSEAIARIPNPAERSALAVALLGKSGAELLPLMQQGAAGIEAAQKEAAKLGIATANLDQGAAKVNAANDAWDRMGMALGGVGQQLAIAVAPAFTAIFDTVAGVLGGVVNWVGNTTEGSNAVIGAVGLVGGAFGAVADVVHTLRIGFGAAQSVIITGLGDIVGGVGFVVKGFQDLLNLIPGVKVEFGNFLQTYSEDLKRLGAEKWEDFQAELVQPPPSQGIKGFFDNLNARMFEAKNFAVDIKKEIGGVTDAEEEAKKTKAKSKENKSFAGAMDLGSAEARSTIMAFQSRRFDNQRELANQSRAQTALQQRILTEQQATRMVMATALAAAVF